MCKKEEEKKDQEPIILDVKSDQAEELLKWLQSEHDKSKEEEKKK